MKWIVPAVVIAIAALIVFQLIWLTREARMQEQEDRKRITEAIHMAADELEKHEAKGFIGNSLDSVFIRQPFPPGNDSTPRGLVNDSMRHIVVIKDSMVYAQHSILPPPPPVPPPPPYGHPGHGGHAQFEAPLTEVPPVPGGWPVDSQQVIVMRTERMKNAVEDVMLEYIFEGTDPMRALNPHVVDSTLRKSFDAKGIDYPFTATVRHARNNQPQQGDTALPAKQDSVWTFYAPLFHGDRIPFRPELVVNVHPGNRSVISQILPQILFAFLLTAGMLLLFVLIYREALKQKKIGDIRRDFINNMTHEFKTPLATMSLAADTIMNDKIIGDKERVKYYAEQIKNENRKLNQQVEKVLELSLAEKNGITLHKEEVNLVSLIQRAVDTMQLQVEARGGVISFGSIVGELKIQADPFHLERVFLNLIDNGMKYGGIPPVISIVIENYRSAVEIKISDNGKGMPQDEWTAIFDPFYRISTGDVHTVKGFGLGLSYAQSVVKEHQGSLTVTKSNITGTTFTLILMHT